jgi:uroporphyrinogen-III synthase/uroporphyrinogen III methyltransferase/synthase
MGPLSGRVIVVTRDEKPGGDPLATRLRALGAAVLEVPSIALAPPADPAPLDAALRDLGGFAWVAFTSANAVTRTLGRARALGVALPGELPRLACVGPATAEALAAAWRAPDLVPEDHRGEALAGVLGPLARGARVLVPRAEEGRPELVDGLARAGAEVVAPVVYRTVPVPPEALAPLVDALARSAVDAIAFASPSAVRSVLAGVGAVRLAEVPLAAIGPTTAAALTEGGLRASIVPVRFTAGDLAEAIAERLR